MQAATDSFTSWGASLCWGDEAVPHALAAFQETSAIAPVVALPVPASQVAGGFFPAARGAAQSSLSTSIVPAARSLRRHGMDLLAGPASGEDGREETGPLAKEQPDGRSRSVLQCQDSVDDVPALRVLRNDSTLGGGREQRRARAAELSNEDILDYESSFDCGPAWRWCPSHSLESQSQQAPRPTSARTIGAQLSDFYGAQLSDSPPPTQVNTKAPELAAGGRILNGGHDFQRDVFAIRPRSAALPRRESPDGDQTIQYSASVMMASPPATLVCHGSADREPDDKCTTVAEGDLQTLLYEVPGENNNRSEKKLAAAITPTIAARPPAADEADSETLVYLAESTLRNPVRAFRPNAVRAAQTLGKHRGEDQTLPYEDWMASGVSDARTPATPQVFETGQISCRTSDPRDLIFVASASASLNQDVQACGVEEQAPSASCGQDCTISYELGVVRTIPYTNQPGSVEPCGDEMDTLPYAVTSTGLGGPSSEAGSVTEAAHNNGSEITPEKLTKLRNGRHEGLPPKESKHSRQQHAGATRQAMSSAAPNLREEAFSQREQKRSRKEPATSMRHAAGSAVEEAYEEPKWLMTEKRRRLGDRAAAPLDEPPAGASARRPRTRAAASSAGSSFQDSAREPLAGRAGDRRQLTLVEAWAGAHDRRQPSTTSFQAPSTITVPDSA